jgi:hypothetical protein
VQNTQVGEARGKPHLIGPDETFIESLTYPGLGRQYVVDGSLNEIVEGSSVFPLEGFSMDHCSLPHYANNDLLNSS